MTKAVRFVAKSNSYGNASPSTPCDWERVRIEGVWPVGVVEKQVIDTLLFCTRMGNEYLTSHWIMA